MIEYVSKDKVKNITLLTETLAEKLPKNILKYIDINGIDYGLAWWLYPIATTTSSTPENFYKIPFVDDDGTIKIVKLGEDIYPDANLCLRPVLRMNRNFKCQVNKIYVCGGVFWIGISDEYLLYYDDVDNFEAVPIIEPPVTEIKLDNFNNNPTDRFWMSSIQKDLDEFWRYAYFLDKYLVLYDDDTYFCSDDITECLNKIYDGLESGKYSKINLVNTQTEKQKMFTMNDLDNL